MSVFVDTSALYAVMDADDANHPLAREAWRSLLLSGTPLVTTNYVLVEAMALVQHRLGLDAARLLQQDICPALHIRWIDEATHRAGVAAVLAASRRRLSLVDCVSFEVMRELGSREAFAFDAHFADQGFSCLPTGQA